MLDVRVSESVAVVSGSLHLGGVKISTYELTSQLKGGANAWVFAGNHPLRGPCVVKVLKGRGENWLDRYANGMSEVQRLAKFGRSSWIAPVFDASYHGDFFYYSMALVKGETLRDVLQQKLTTSERWRLGQEYIAALFHTNDVLHADPHPGNVIVAPNWRNAAPDDAQFTLIDFGPGWPLVKRSLRHRKRVMREVMLKIVRKLPGYQRYKNEFKSPHGSLTKYMRLLELLKPA